MMIQKIKFLTLTENLKFFGIQKQLFLLHQNFEVKNFD